MMKTMNRWMVSAVLCVGCAALDLHAETPATSAFTYQGLLMDNGQAANGEYDFVFRLFDAAVIGLQVGADVNVADWPVEDGLFTVTLDFGAAALNGNARWLAVQVRPGASGGGYTPLAPRQPLTVAPYAQYALNSYWQQDGTAIMNTNTGFVGVNRTDRVTGSEYFGIQAPVDFGYGGMYIRTDGAAGKPFYGYNVPGQTAWTYLDGSNGKWHLYLDSDERLTVVPGGNVGIGTESPSAKLDVTTSSGNGIEGSTTGAFSFGVVGTGTSAGVRGTSGASNGAGVEGVNNTSGGAGVEGSSSGNGSAGVAGYANNGTGVYGQTSSGYGVYGSNGGSNVTGHAGYFNGRVHVAGNLSKSGGAFTIDHPLDPANKTLSHSFVESPDMMNIYNGNVVLDADGAALVTLPDWFDALNREFRYQLTAIGAPAPNLHVAEELADNTFVIAGGLPGMKVSWQVTGVRQDPWAEANRIAVEEAKPAAQRGLYLHPELYGADASQAIGAVPQERTDREAALPPHAAE